MFVIIISHTSTQVLPIPLEKYMLPKCITIGVNYVFLKNTSYLWIAKKPKTELGLTEGDMTNL